MLKTASGDRRAEPLANSNLNPEQMQKLSVFVSSLHKPLEQKAKPAKLRYQMWVNGKALESASWTSATLRNSA